MTGLADVIVSTKDGLLVCIYPGHDTAPETDLSHALSRKTTGRGPWGSVERGVGRARWPVRTARPARRSSSRRGLDRNVAIARFEDLLVYR